MWESIMMGTTNALTKLFVFYLMFGFSYGTYQIVKEGSSTLLQNVIWSINFLAVIFIVAMGSMSYTWVC